MKKLIPKYQNGGFTGLMPIMPNTLIKSAFNLVAPLVRRNLYDNLTPVGYSSIPTIVKAAIGIPSSFNARAGIPERDDLWAEYLGIPKEKRHKLKRKVTISPSMYKPTKGKPNPRTFRIDNLSDKDKKQLIDYTKEIYIGDNKLINYNINDTFDGLGRFTVGKGHDSKGTYISYYDNWNLSPFGNKEVGGGGAEDESFGIGNPFDVYDRIYLDDYYNVPKEYRGAYFIPEIEVVANKKASNSQ